MKKKEILQLLQKKKYSEAERLVDQQLKTHPDDPSAHNFKGAIHLFRHQPKKALASFEAAVKGNARNKKFWSNKAIAHAMLDQYIEAAACWRKTLAIDPQNSVAVEGLRQALERQQQCEKPPTSWWLPMSGGSAASLFLSYVFTEGVKIPWYWMFPVSVVPTICITLGFKYCADHFQPVEDALPVVVPEGYVPLVENSVGRRSIRSSVTTNVSFASSSCSGIWEIKHLSSVNVPINAIEGDLTDPQPIKAM